MNEKHIQIPGSKSLTNRALLLAALAEGTSTIQNILLSDDTRVMMSALRELDINIEEKGTTLKLTSDGSFKAPEKPLYLGNAGTAVRFLTAILSTCPFNSQIEGDERMKERPIRDLIDALNSIGADIQATNGCPPLKINGHPLTEKEVHITGKNSSQYISALMMLAPLLPNGLTIHVDGETTSKPYLDMTLDLMNKFFIQNTERNGYKSFKIPHQNYRSANLTIEADASSATYFAGLAAITGQTVTLQNISRKTLQPDTKILDHLEQIGCSVSEDKNGITIIGPEQLKPLGTVNANDFPDGAMTLAVIAAFAEGTTTLTGLHNLRIKESDRIEALKTELSKMGAQVEITEDSITVHGQPEKLHGARISTYNDHRIAMCFGMAGCAVTGIEIENPACVNKTYPIFWDDLKKTHPKSPYPNLL